MSDLYKNDTKNLETIIDFLRFGLSRANEANIYFGHGTDNAWDDLWALILKSLSLPLDIDPLLLQAKLTTEEKTTITRQLERRILSRVPMPYLINEAYFCDLPFFVDERVLIPRSPIAELIKTQFEPWVDPNQVHRVLDLCTGSGCIAIACAYAFPDALVDATDISSEALAVATMNRERHDLEETLGLIQSDVFESIPKTSYDLIVSNPPYVGSAEMQTLPEEYRHEPALGLLAKNNGLAVVEKILVNAHAYLSDHGILVIEVGNSHEALQMAYPEVPFLWLDFEHGGHGVFLLTAEQVNTYFGK